MPCPPYYDGRHATTGEPVLIAGSRCFCDTCHLVFSGESAFDRHRIGRYEPYQRRCLTIPQMASKHLYPKPSGVIGRRVSRADAPGNSGPSPGPQTPTGTKAQSLPE